MWGQKLKAARLRGSYSQEEIAERLDASTKTIRRWEQGACSPRPYNRRKIVDLLKELGEEMQP